MRWVSSRRTSFNPGGKHRHQPDNQRAYKQPKPAMTDNPNPMPDSSPRLTIAAFVIIALAIIGGAILLLSTRPEPVRITINPPPPTATPPATGTPGPITVYVTGAVGKPESMITLPSGSRVQDAIDAAGGAAENANLEGVNLAGI